jgi:ppGpp synthetase/RelA/SpoT-type nucleotidyltranferase
MSETKDGAFRQWYSARQHLYQEVAEVAKRTLRTLVNDASIDMVSIEARAKDIESAVQKVGRKGYSAPEREMTDLAGVRVITYVETDVPKVARLVERAFHVITDKSTDKTAELGVDRSGYRSLHYVCDLGQPRLGLPEWEKFQDVLFEIQLRTALQHAWAEIEHDRRYKFSGVLPTLLQRRLNLLAGMLEIADREFAAVAAEVDRYAHEVALATKAGELDVEVNSTSVLSYLNERLKNLRSVPVDTNVPELIPAIIIEELRTFGIQTLAQLNMIVTDALLDAIDNSEYHYVTHVGILRDAMMYSDIGRYFASTWQNHWQGFETDTVAFHKRKFGDGLVDDVIATYKLDVIEPQY